MRKCEVNVLTGARYNMIEYLLSDMLVFDTDKTLRHVIALNYFISRIIVNVDMSC
jgi:hypothetical protein